MTESAAHLIYNACLRVEAKYEIPLGTSILTPELARRMAVYEAVKAIREEIGNGLSGAAQ